MTARYQTASSDCRGAPDIGRSLVPERIPHQALRIAPLRVRSVGRPPRCDLVLQLGQGGVDRGDQLVVGGDGVAGPLG